MWLYCNTWAVKVHTDLALVCCCPSKNIILIYVLSGVCAATEVTRWPMLGYSVIINMVHICVCVG